MELGDNRDTLDVVNGGQNEDKPEMADEGL